MRERDVFDDQSIGACLKPYPYADAKTYEFLQNVIRNGTQNALSKHENEGSWVKYRNITGIYFSCNITREELADMYGVTRQRIDRIISKTLRRFWDNSIGSDQMDFPIESLSTENPATKHRVFGFSGMDQIRFESLVSSGADDNEIAKRFSVNLDLVRQKMRRMGKREQITSRIEANRRLLEELDTLPVENFDERQRAINQVTLHCCKYYRESFVNISDVAVILGKSMPRRREDTDKFINELKNVGIPAVIVPSGYITSKGYEQIYAVVHRRDFQRLREDLKLSTNPS